MMIKLMTEYSRLVPENRGTVFPPGGRVGCSVASFQLLSGDGHSQWRRGRSRHAHTSPDPFSKQRQ